MAEAQVQTPLSALRIDRLVTPLKQHRGPRWLIPAVLLVTALVLFGSSLSRRAPTVVRVAEVRAPQLEAPRAELSAAGYVDSRRRAVIAPRLPGRLVDVTVKVGEFVKQGQVVARLDDGDARVVLSRAEAEVRAAEARLAAARARITHAQRTPKGTWSLAKLGVIPHARFLNVEPSGSALQEELDAAKAHFAAALRAREGARLQLSHTVVRAPREGTVARMLAGEGAVLASVTREGASLGGILELVDLDTLEVEAEVSEEQRSQLRAGQPALIFLEAVPHRAFPGRVGTVPSARERSRRPP
ncbi:efflux RND transporter periplasmic adaptor subunit [Pyxidicoccus sp. 3LFB2]